MNRLVIDATRQKGKIHKNLYGHFSEHLGRCIYGGLYVGEDSSIPNINGLRTDAVEALKAIRVPVLRWPGGCFADEYHWKDGVGPKEQRKKMINTHWGGVVEDNRFGTHEFMELCRQLNCEPYINLNLGSGTVQEMQEWVEYMTFDGISPMTEWRRQNGREQPWKVKYLGIGNENWGCGGNMRPEYYADLYRRYQTFVRNYGENTVYKIACGPNVDDYRWTETVMKNAGAFLDAITLHYYTIPGEDWNHKGSATEFDEAIYYRTLRRALRMEKLITRHTNIMERFDPDHRVGLIVDEWGAWYDVEPGTNPGFLYQQNTMRDALLAAVTLNIFNKHCDRVVMANLAQMVNVLQAVLLTEGDKLLLTPTYHVYDLYQHHQDATLLDSHLQAGQIQVEDGSLPALQESASIDAQGAVHITLSNLSAQEGYPVEVTLLGKAFETYQGEILAGSMQAHNTFEQPEAVTKQVFQGLSRTAEQTVQFQMPPCSVLHLELK